MNILCRFGFHKPDADTCICVYKSRGKHKWQRNYAMCKRCGKKLHKVKLSASGVIG